ncbi:hypothetical protein BR93DRAFT_489877 [Coniochaeta sp. PMI_546]|nr:hypothetical protein BR93DRAFT_489877 [Coniochaeta sp. PMI_546]
MADTRTLNWFESDADNKSILDNGWNFQIAKSVATGSAAPTYNLVWQSQALAPVTIISWKIQYALSWTAAVPSDGVKIKIQGQWQKCDKGQSFDIDSRGYWRPSTKPVSPSDASWLNVGNINYSYPGVLGLHIIVGVLNAQTGKYEAVFVDQATLPAGSSAKYQPQESVSWWLEASDLTGQVFNSTKSRSTTYDFTKESDPLTHAYEWSTSYVMQGGVWTIAPGSPPQALTGPPPSAELAQLTLGGSPPVVLQLDHASWLITFTVPLAVAALTAIGASLLDKLKSNFKNLKVNLEGKDGTTIRFEYDAGGNAAPGTVEYLGTPVGASGGPKDTIENALRDLQTTGAIPSNEKWDVTPTTKPYAPAITAPKTPFPPAESQERFSNGGFQPTVKAPFGQGFSNATYNQPGITA